MIGEAGRLGPKKISLIWAQDRNLVLGSGTGMLWRIPADFAHFKASTMGCPIIMGRASWEALGRPLPGRENLVLSRRSDYQAQGAVVLESLEQALRHCADAKQVWITGGGQVYREALEKQLADELVITDLDFEVARCGPLVYAPAIDLDNWQIDTQRSDGHWREKSGDARWRVTYWLPRKSPVGDSLRSH